MSDVPQTTTETHGETTTPVADHPVDHKGEKKKEKKQKKGVWKSFKDGAGKIGTAVADAVEPAEKKINKLTSGANHSVNKSGQQLNNKVDEESHKDKKTSAEHKEEVTTTEVKHAGPTTETSVAKPAETL